ncbi:MAG: hypothetical protein P1V20_11285 [Verrucomicrobiales bacterium]|nr:hypothetical protein [Verrucomicrobiales bacterium]
MKAITNTIPITETKLNSFNPSRSAMEQEFTGKMIGFPVHSGMLGHVRSILTGYWNDYQNDLSALIIKKHRLADSAAIKAAQIELDLCKNYQGFLLLSSSPTPDTIDVAKKRFEMIRAMRLVTSALQRELGRCCA